MNASLSLKTTLLTAAAALLCTGLQFTGIDSLAAQRAVDMKVVQLPAVVITAQRDAAATTAVVQQLPQVVVVGRRLDRATATAQVDAGASSI